MRISVIKTDPGHRAYAHLYRVTLNGVERQDCHTADDEAGTAQCLVGGIDEVIEHGKIEIIPPTPYALAVRAVSLITIYIDAIDREALVDVDRAHSLYRDELIAIGAELIDALKPRDK